MEEKELIDRREAVKRAALMLGGLFFMPAASAVLKGCSITPGDWTPVLLNHAQATLTEHLAEAILPRTDTPGAIDAGVPAFIDRMAGEFFNDADREGFIAGLDRFAEEVREATGRAFHELSDAEKLDYITEANREAIEGEHEEQPFFLVFKRVTLTGYCMSEPGMTQHLRYMQNFGPYRGCVPMEEVGRAWAHF